MYTPFPKMYNPFLVSEPTYTAPQQNIYPEMTGDIQAQLSDANRLYGKNNPGIDITQQPDPLYSPANMGFETKLREYNQPTLLQDKLNNYSSIVKNIEEAKGPFASAGDINGKGVLLQKDITTPELDMMMGKVENPYTMDYTPFESEEEMLKYYNPPYPDPLNPEPIKIETLDASGIKDLAKNMALPNANQFMGNVFNSEDDGFEVIPEAKEIDALKALAPAIKLMTGMGQNTNNGIPKKEPILPGTDQYQTETPKNKFGMPEAYYLGKSILDSSALINNMVQPQPPSLQMKIPHFERQRLNPEPYDAMRSQIRDQGTQAYRLQRENISQASDLMKGLSAVTSGTQQAMMNVGLNQAAALQQVQDKNLGISMQEQGMQTEILNQEAATNYQIQAQAQQFKDQMISAQLARLGDTAGAYAKYANMKTIVEKQEKINKAAIQSTNDIQNAMLQYQMHKDAIDSDEYKSAWAQHWSKSLDQMAIDKISDDKYNLVKEYYGESAPRYGDYQRKATNSAFVQDYYRKRNSVDMFEKLYPGGVAPQRDKYTSDDDYNNALADFNKYQSDYKSYNEDKSYKMFEQEQDLWSEVSKERDESGERKRFADMYMKQRGYYTSEQLLETVKEALERSKQSLEI